MSRIAVVGAGAIGGVSGGYLAALGRNEIVFCVREPFEKIGVKSPAGAFETPLCRAAAALLGAINTGDSCLTAPSASPDNRTRDIVPVSVEVFLRMPALPLPPAAFSESPEGGG
ncbi:2-dehydropantoate 2-reductase N-terminal domain-containing protein [Nitrospinota bacterium]